jgi:hypothetical protein
MLIEDKIKRLPKWAQDHIIHLERERDVSVRKLNDFCDNQTKSPIFIDDLICTGEEKGPSKKRNYIQSKRIELEYSGVYLQIICRDNCIDLNWSNGQYGSGEVAFIPVSFQAARLTSKENMR